MKAFPILRQPAGTKVAATEAVAIFLLIVAVVVIAAYYRAVLFIVVPVILIAVFRFGTVGAAVGMLVTAVVGSVFIINGIGSPVILQASTAERIMALLIFLAATALWSFPIAAALAQRDRLMTELDAAKAQLESENEKKSQMVVGLHHRLVNAEEKERLRLSHELHDQTGQAQEPCWNSAELKNRSAKPSAIDSIACASKSIGSRKRSIASPGSCDPRQSMSSDSRPRLPTTHRSGAPNSASRWIFTATAASSMDFPMTSA